MSEQSDKWQRRLVVDQFTPQATPFREFAEMPGHPRKMVLAATDIKPDDTVLDVACGLGVTTCDLAEVARHATGIDGVIAICRKMKTDLMDDSSPSSFPGRRNIIPTG